MNHNVGILGVGTFLPPDVRTNDWWPASVVQGWMAQRATARPAPHQPRTKGEALVGRAMSEQAYDPFQGAIERRVMPAGMTIFDMEEHAAREAIVRARVDPQAIDLVLTHTVVPDVLLGNPACILHQRLGLPRECLTMQADAATYSFMAQLTLAEAMIASGRARHALLVQSCGASRLIDPTDPISPLFGDGASAVVVGSVSAGRGILGSVHFTDGRYPRTLVASPRGRTWFDDGRSVLHVADPAQMHEVFLGTADVCKESVDQALARSGHAANEVDFFCVHQGTPWLRKVVQAHTGLEHARSIETFARTGYLFAAILPIGLRVAEDEGLLVAGKLAVITGGGPGQTFGAFVLRWGT